MDKGKRIKGNECEELTHIDKTQVLQEARQTFMQTNAKTKKLVDVLTRCIYILYQGERLAPNEATDLFFHITRLFQYKDKDSTLRRLTYIGIKALSQQAENVYVVTSSLTTDVNSSRDDPAVRASALRALCQICDASTYPTIERYLSQSVVDKHPVVASAALSSLIKISSVNMSIVQRCTREIQEALKSDSPMVQYHALGLRYIACKNDKLAIARLISVCIKDGLKSPLAICQLIRIITNYINENEAENTHAFYDYIKNGLANRHDMVEYEAANALINLKPHLSDAKGRTAAVAHLRNFLSSSKAASRFAAVRSLNKLAITHPDEVRVANLELENLISKSDCNRSIAILAITTLLKTGTEKSVETFLKQIGEFLSEIDDEFKIIVVGSVRQLCQKYPSKHAAMMDFLSDMLREEGGYAYKKAIVDTIIKIIEDYDETKEKGLEQLCEFIEDCEHTLLSIEVLNLIGREGPKTKKASTYIRFIANRLLLDNSMVACAATTALAKFGVVPELRSTIRTVLDRFDLHEDYEVMERAFLYKNILSFNDACLQSKFITNPAPKVSFSDLENKLMDYLESDCTRPFDMSSVAPAQFDHVISQESGALAQDDDLDDQIATNNANSGNSQPTQSGPRPPMDVFDDIELGDLINTTKPISLTDQVAEFGVQCMKHIYKRHIVFQFDCTNTVNSMCLEDVSIEICAPPGFRTLANTECERLAFEETQPIYICVEVVDDSPCPMGNFTKNNMRYKYRLVDTETNEVDDEVSDEENFLLEDLQIELADFMVSMRKNFKHVWIHGLSVKDEVEHIFSLEARKLNQVVPNMINVLGMEVFDGTDIVPAGKRQHELRLGALFHGRTEILIRVSLVERGESIAIKFLIRCTDKELASVITQMF